MALSNFLNKQEAKKLFTPKEIEIMHKQLMGISLTQPEKNVLSRSVRKKLQAVDQLSHYRDEFLLKKSQERQRLIKKALQVILNDPLKKHIDSVLLFGSTLGKTTKSSDIDICVRFTKISLKNATKFRIRTMSELPGIIDIQVFNTLPDKIQKEIQKNHKVLYKN